MPKELRDRLNVRGGEQLDIVEVEGHLEIRFEGRDADLVRTKHGLLAAAPDDTVPDLTSEDVRELLERTRR